MSNTDKTVAEYVLWLEEQLKETARELAAYKSSEADIIKSLRG